MSKKTKAPLAAEAEAAEELTTFDVISNLHHDGKLYRKGSTVDLTAAEAANLLNHKTVKAQETVEEQQ